MGADDSDLMTPSTELFDALRRMADGPTASCSVVIGSFGTRITAAVDVVIGRSADIVVDDKRVSRRHLRLVADPAGGILAAADAGSGNGSWMVRDGERHRLDADLVDLRVDDRIVTIDDVELLHVVEVAG